MLLMLLIAEVDVADEVAAQAALDDFREQANSSAFGITIARARPEEVARFDLAAMYLVPVIAGSLDQEN